MVKLFIDEDCGNAPKKQYIKEFNIAFAESDIEKILSMITDDAIWNIVGEATYKGLPEIKSALEKMSEAKPTELWVENIISHGNRCSANGVLVFEDSKLEFCDVYAFNSFSKDAKVKKITSYGINT